MVVEQLLLAASIDLLAAAMVSAESPIFFAHENETNGKKIKLALRNFYRCGKIPNQWINPFNIMWKWQDEKNLKKENDEVEDGKDELHDLENVFWETKMTNAIPMECDISQRYLIAIRNS